MRATVFDGYALLALFFDEPAAGQVETILQEAAVAEQPILITVVNWAEVLYRMQRMRGTEGLATAKRFGSTMPLELVPADLALAEQAAAFKAAYKMSLADAFAAALARQKKADLVTGDPEFKAVEDKLKITWLK